jgi:hypothetical protein
VVAAVGLTVVSPLAAADVNDPGEMATLVAPVVAQPSVVVPPAPMVVGLAVKELMMGRFTTLTVALAVTDPPALVAVKV